MSTAPKSPKADEAPAAPAEAKPSAVEAVPSKKEKTPGREPKEGKGKDGKEGKEGKEGKGKSGKGGPPSTKKARVAPDNPNFRYIVRLGGSDLDGLRSTALALTGVKGVGLRVAEVVCRLAQVDPHEMIGNLPEPTVTGIEGVLSGLPEKLPPWMLNHAEEYITGEARHLIAGDLETARRDDVNQMKMIRSYRGVRHERGQKVRGQRTRSNGRTGMAAGVLKKAAKEAAAAKGKEGAAPAAAPAATPAAAPAAPAAAPAKKA